MSSFRNSMTVLFKSQGEERPVTIEDIKVGNYVACVAGALLRRLCVRRNRHLHSIYGRMALVRGIFIDMFFTNNFL